MKCKQPLPITAKSWPFKDRCSRCRARRKRPLLDPKQSTNTIDHHWCDRCYITAPVSVRHRRISRREWKQINARQAIRAEEVRLKKARKLAKLEAQKAANKTTNTATTSKRKNGGKDAGSVTLEYEFAEVRDKSIFEEESTD